MWSREYRRYRRDRDLSPTEQATREGINAGCFFLAVALLLVLWNTYEGFRIWQSESWQKTAGRIVSSHAVAGTGLLAFTHHAEVEYAFTARGRLQKSRNLRWGSEYRLSRSWAEGEAARYPVGAQVEVYFDPEATNDTVLEPGLNRHFFFDCLVSLVLIGLAFLGMNWVFEKTNRILMRYN